MNKLNQEFKNGQFHNLYLLHGEESYLCKQYKERLKKLLLPDDNTMNYHYYNGKSFNVREVIDLSETLPFFSKKRVIIIEESFLFQKDKDSSEEALLAEYLKTVPETTVFIFVEGKIDKRLLLYKTIKKYGSVAEFTTPGESDLQKWVLGMVKNEKKEISPAALSFFLGRTGFDMNHIKCEIEKLFSYCHDKDEITMEDIDIICAKQLHDNIFEMIEAIALKQQKKALEIYYDMMAAKEPPVKILVLIGRQFTHLLQVKDLGKRGYGKDQIAAKAGLHPFVAGKYLSQSGRFKTSYLIEVLEDCAKADEDIKTGRMNDMLALELFIVKYSSQVNKA